MDKFLHLPAVEKALPDNLEEILPRLYYFKGKFPTLPARGILGDRYVMVGDAAGLNRPFKVKGINSADMTGMRAAEVMVYRGISRGAFQEYLKRCSELTDDIRYGKTLRFITIQGAKNGLLDSLFEVAKDEPLLRKAFFNIVSGQKTYKKTWSEIKSVSFLWRIILKVIKNRFLPESKIKKENR